MVDSTVYVRKQFLPAENAPVSDATVLGWLRLNLFGSIQDTILTLAAVGLVAWFLPGMIEWLFISAIWTGSDRTACATVAQGGHLPDGWSGACWAYVGDKFQQFMIGSYPRDQVWRPYLVAALFVATLVPFLVPKIPHKGWNAILLLIVLPVIAYFLLLGGHFGLRYVETSYWGGLMVTLILSYVGIGVSLPVGVLLALGRRSSKMPVVRMLSIAFIELIRGVPLITVLFMASVVLPLFMAPGGTGIDKFLRALVGVSIFSSAYMAEVIRGGLQAIPKGQYEAGDALGLNYFQKITFVILPQALKLVIPGIVNTFIGMFKDTSLVSIISMFDLLGIVKVSFADANWLTPVTPITGLIFAGFVFWLFCFGMSRYSRFVEQRLDTGHKR